MFIDPARQNHIDHAIQRGARPNKDGLAPFPRKIFLLVGVVGLFLTSLVGYGFYTGYRISTTYAPLIDAVMEIKMEATAAHLGLEEVLHDDLNESYHSVLLHVEETMWYLRALLKGGKNFEGTFVPVPTEELLQEAKAAQRKFIKLKSMILHRLDRQYAQKPDEELDEEHDALYKSFIKEVDQIETRLQQLMSKNLNRFRIVQAILITACIMLAVVTGIYFWRIEHQRLQNYHSLEISHSRLETEMVKRKLAESKVQKAKYGLELKVLERTYALDTANKKLAREVIERRRVEKDLLSHQARLRALSSELSMNEERERRRIAQALHDGIGQNLSAISMNKLTKLRNTNSPEIDAGLDDICELVKHMIEETRLLIFELAPSTLYEIGLVPAVDELIDKVQKQHNLRVDYHGDGLAKIEDEGVRAFLFQAVRELLANIIQHAGARTARVSIRKQGRNIRIDVQDDGIGFDVSDGSIVAGKNNGLGIFKINERLLSFGGTLEIKSKANKGSHAVLVTPLK